MLQGQLDDAARKTRQNLIIFGLCAVVFITLIALTLVVTRYSTSEKETIEVTATQIDDPSSAPSVNPSDETASPSKPSVEPLSKASNRDVLALINQFEETIEPKLATPEFGAWNQGLREKLLSEKRQAVDALAMGNVDQAYEQLARTLKSAEEAIAELDGEFAAQIDNALSALSVDAYREANIAINKALALKVSDADAIRLKEQIEKLPEILSLMEQVDIARTENDLYKEQQLSLKISQIDPTRTAYAERADEIDTLLMDRKYEDIIISGNEASNSENLKALQQSTQVAKSLFSRRAETKDLEEKLTALKRKIAFNAFMTDAHSAVTNDNWKAALTAYMQAETIHPNDKEVIGGIGLASQIIQYQNSILGFNKDPGRLANEAVKRSAENILNHASTMGAISPSLNTELVQLKTNIENFNRLVEIRVISDGLTDVSVRGVGQIGVVSQYSIRLKPGSYRLEGKRQGYKTKSISITISPEDTNVRVEIIADERI